jgi:nucleoside-diphosphate-sugar epimerase
MQTILGANGAIAEFLARELHQHYTTDLRLVSRNPKLINPTDQLHPANLLDPEQTLRAVAGSEIAYMTVGLPLNTAQWVEQWPVLMQNIIRACQAHGTKLVFFDNTYMYPQTGEVLREDTRFAPNGPKGQVRGEIAQLLLDEMVAGRIEALIARAPEFYGPKPTQSFTNANLFANIRQGKKLRVFGRDDTLRSLIYAPDASRATALLGNTPDAYGQTWHLPCDDNRLTYKQFIALASEVYGRELDYNVVPIWLLKTLALFKDQLREVRELLPRYVHDNVFESTKFKQQFPTFRVTTYREGIRSCFNF